MPLTLRMTACEQLAESYQICMEEQRRSLIDDLLRECERHLKEGNLSGFISENLSEKGVDAASLHQGNDRKKNWMFYGLERLRPGVGSGA